MESFKNIFKSTVNEKVKVSKSGGGYIESILNGPSSDKFNGCIDELSEVVSEFMRNSEEYAEEEGLKIKEQEEQIIDDVIAYIYATLK